MPIAFTILIVTGLAVIIIYLMWSIMKEGNGAIQAITNGWLYFMGRLKSTKFQIMVIGTVLLCVSKIGETTWLLLAGAYIGVNFLQKKFVDNGRDYD